MTKLAFGVAAVAALLLAGVTVVGRMAGEDAGARSKERLQLVWPSIMEMPVDDRALLVDLSMTCHVEQRPAVPAAVVACLRGALDDPHALFPSGLYRESARSKLDRLLLRKEPLALAQPDRSAV